MKITKILTIEHIDPVQGQNVLMNEEGDMTFADANSMMVHVRVQDFEVPDDVKDGDEIVASFGEPYMMALDINPFVMSVLFGMASMGPKEYTQALKEEMLRTMQIIRDHGLFESDD